MVAAWQAMANVSLAAGKDFWDPRLLWLTLVLVAIILLGAVVIVWVDRWRKTSDAEPLDATDQLAYYQELYDQGEISLKEFERIRAKLLSQQGMEAAPPPGITTKQPKPPGGSDEQPEKEADPGSSLA
jgi:hypothetical protein